MMRDLAVITTTVARHELYRKRGFYHIVTTNPGDRPSDIFCAEFGRRLTTAEAADWVETVRRCGGVVDERAVPT